MDWMGSPWRALRRGTMVLFLALLASCGGGTGNSAEAALGRVLSDDVSAFRGNGTWWNPAEPGTGFFFEAQGGVAIVSFFVYDEEGRPVWYSAAGAFNNAGPGRFQFQGPLQRFEAGPVINAADSVRTTRSTSVGTVTIAFEGSERAQVQLPKRTIQAVKFATRAPVASAGAIAPETGVFWDPQRNGRGFTVEVDGGSVTIGLYGFTRDGRPTWRLAVGELKAGVVKVRPQLFRLGQTLDGPYRSPIDDSAQLTAEDDVVFQFETPCFGAIALNGSLALERFAFNGGGCRTASPVAPAQRLMLAPDLPASTAFSLKQLQAIAARALQVVEVVVSNESLVPQLAEWHREFAPGSGRGACPLGGEARWNKVDADGNGTLTTGDALHFDSVECRLKLVLPDGDVETTLTGLLTMTREGVAGNETTHAFRFDRLLRAGRTTALLDGDVRVRTKQGAWSSEQEFAGLDVTMQPDGQRTTFYSGIARRIGRAGDGADVTFDQFLAGLPISKTERVRARLRVEGTTPMRFTPAGNLDHAPGHIVQGVLLIELEPHKADGARLRLQVTGTDRLVIEHWSGSQLLSTQLTSHGVIRAAAGL